MAYLVEIPVDGGGLLRVQGAEDDIPRGLEPVAVRGRAELVILRARESVEAALDELKPALTAATTRLRALAADEVTIEFGLLLGVEGGAVVAKGKSEVHFTVTLTWNRPGQQESGTR